MNMPGRGRPSHFYGYVNSLFVGIALFLLGGANYLLPALSGFMKDDLGWTATGTGGAFSVYYVVFGATTFLAGSLVLRFGPRRLIAAGALVVVVTSVLLSLTQELWQFYLLAGVYAVGCGRWRCGHRTPIGRQLATQTPRLGHRPAAGRNRTRGDVPDSAWRAGDGGLRVLAAQLAGHRGRHDAVGATGRLLRTRQA